MLSYRLVNECGEREWLLSAKAKIKEAKKSRGGFFRQCLANNLNEVLGHHPRYEGEDQKVYEGRLRGELARLLRSVAPVVTRLQWEWKAAKQKAIPGP